MKPDEMARLILESQPQYKAFSLATIDPAYTSGRPKLVFDGDTVATQKTYPYLASYTPSANHRVLVADIAGTHVVLGRIL